MDENIKKLLRELGTAINDSISGSDEVNRQMQRIRDHGYNLYVMLDATVGLNKDDEDGLRVSRGGSSSTAVAPMHEHEIQFRINVNDLALLRGLGIDPTRKVRTARRVERIGQTRDGE